MVNSKLIWGKHEIKTENVFQFRGGFCSFKIKRIVNGWFNSDPEKILSEEKVSFLSVGDSPEEENTNIYQTGRSDQLFLLPSLPVKPVVFKPKSQIKISPRQSIRLFIIIPCNVQLYYGQIQPDHLMAEYELTQLSNTWFGEPDNGEAAFSIGSGYSLHNEQPNQKDYEVTCPVKINNNSSLPLDLQRFIIHVENLTIYRKKNQLITNLVSIDFKGPDQVSNIHLSTEKAIHDENPGVVARPRNTGSNSILRKSFHFIKHFTQ